MKVFAAEQHNRKLSAYSDSITEIHFNAKRAAHASEELLSIAQRASRK